MSRSGVTITESSTRRSSTAFTTRRSSSACSGSSSPPHKEESFPMDREIVRRGLIEAVFVVLAGFSMGALVVVANFAEYGLWLSLEVGGPLIFVAHAAGMAIGLSMQYSE